MSMNKLLTKKNILISSLATVVAVLFLGIMEQKCYENVHSSCWQYWDKIPESFQVLYLAFPILLFSLITYKLRDEVFETWIKLTKWWVIGTAVLVLIAPAQGHSLLPVTKEIISIFSAGIYALISTVVVISKSVILKQKK